MKIHCQTYGKGTKKLICIHGFGQDSRIFRIWDDQTDYQILAIDLFFHGKSTWESEKEFLEFSEWKHIFQEFLTENQIDRFSMAGFSMGGKVSLVTLSLFADKINELFLFAPDGVTINFWYKLATKYAFSKFLFELMLGKFYPFLNQIGLFFKKIKVLNAIQWRLYQTQTNSAEKRVRLVKSWLLYRDFDANFEEVNILVEKFKIKTAIFVGKNDHLIPPKAVEKLAKIIPSAKYIIFEGGHHIKTNLKEV